MDIFGLFDWDIDDYVIVLLLILIGFMPSLIMKKRYKFALGIVFSCLVGLVVFLVMNYKGI